MNKERFYKKMDEENLDYILVCSHENVCYCSGVPLPLPYGATFEYGNGCPLAYVLISRRDKKEILIISSFYKELAEEYSMASKAVYFENYNHFLSLNSGYALCEALSSVIENNATKMSIGIESLSLPSHVLFLLNKMGLIIQDCTDMLAWVRRIKTLDELEKMRHAAYVEDCGQNRLLQYAREFDGETEFEMWSGIQLAMNIAAKHPVDISGELVTGPGVQSPNYPGGPNDRKVCTGDMGRMDISIRLNGYWNDCTNTVVFGQEPNEKQKEYFKIVYEAFEAAKNMLRPGKRVCEVDAAAKHVYERYGKQPIVYTGHQIGCGVNESPRIVCYEDMILEPNMVVCIEPQQYAEAGSNVGVRLERMLLITNEEPEELNKFSWGIQL